MELYISSTDSDMVYAPQKIVNYQILKKKSVFFSRYYLHIETQESLPLFGLDKYGINQKSGANFILSSRYIGKDIEKLEKFPITVNVFISKSNNFSRIKSEDDLIFYGIANLYNNFDDAKRHVIMNQLSKI